MKNIYLISILSILFVSSCYVSDDQLNNIDSESVTLEEYFEKNERDLINPQRKFLTAHSLGTQKAIYNLIDEDSKLLIWKSKILQCANNNYFKKSQQRYLTEIAKNLTLNNLNSVNYQNKLENEMIGLEFSYIDIESIFFNLNNLDELGNPINNSIHQKTPAPFSADGDCTTRNGWCSCGDYGFCVSGCSQTDSGCGWFWTQSCDRYCTFY